MRLFLGLFFAIFAFAAQASQVQYRLDLRDLMDSHYGVGSWSFWTGIGTGTDIGPALQDGIAQIQAIPSSNRTGEIDIGPFNWAMKNAPADFAGITIKGVTSSRSVIVYQTSNGVAFAFKSGPGGGIEHLAILLESGLGDTTSIAIFMYGSSTAQPDQTTFRDLYITAVGGSSYWWDDIHLDGENRTSPIGIRVGYWENIQVFNSRNLPIYLGSAIQHTFINVGCYTGKGPYAGQILIQGTAAVPSVNNTILATACQVVNGANAIGTTSFGN